MKRLVIIDGKSVFYRGYYAMGALATSEGVPTGGIYGFAAIAMEIVRSLKPTKVVVAWDSKSSTAKRKAIFPEYKAGRKKPGDDFYAQIPMLEELVKALGWSFVECDEYEADDIIGTLSLQADEDVDAEGKCQWETFIVSSDLDMLQVVDENTRMYRVLKGFSKLEELDVAGVEEKYGIRKAQFLDLKALKGDASDNIPGVPGIGEKTAVKLLAEYGTLEGVLAAASKGEVAGKTGEKLREGAESARMSYRLAKIMTDAPVVLMELPDLVIDKARIIEALKKLEFRTLIRKFEAVSGGSGVSGASNVSEASNVSGASNVDGENRGAEGGAFGVESNVKEREVDSAVKERGTALLEKVREEKGKIEARKAELKEQRQQSLEIPQYGEDGVLLSWNVKDLMHKNGGVAEQVLTNYHKCDTMVRGDDVDASSVLACLKFWDLGQGAFLLNPLAREVSYGDERVEYGRQKYEFAQSPKLYKIFTQFDLPLVPVLYQMEAKGMAIDRGYFQRLGVEFGAEVKKREQEIWKLSGKEFNVNSPIQLSEVLFTDLRLPTKGIKKTSRGYSTGVKELDKLEGLHPVIEKIKEYREAAKLLSTYILPLPELADTNGRVHTTFNQNVTATGRLSSTAPNLQNIPVRTEVGRMIRTGFVAPRGKKLVNADYSQFELRLAAVLAGDEQLIADFNADADIHTKTAAEAFGVPITEVTKAQRRAAKVINFGILYGMSVRGLATAAGMEFNEAKQFIDNYFELRRSVKEYLEGILKQAREQGYVETFYGRRRPTPDVLSSNFVVRTGAERAAQNMPIQGTEADLMKRAMLRVYFALPKGTELVMQVHDSLMVECDEALVPEVSEILKREMEGVAPELGVKLKVDVAAGDNWGEL